MKRSAMKRTGRIAPRNRKRAAANLQRAYGSPSRREWIKAQPCYQCGFPWCDGAHIKNGGGSRKADAAVQIPLCMPHEVLRDGVRVIYEGCHRLQHAKGWSALPKLDTIDKRDAAARDIAARWLTITQEAANG